MMGPMMHQGPMPQQMAAGPQPTADLAKEFKEQQAQPTEQADLAQAAQMVEMLKNSGNPKFANSKFVSFIDKVSKGELQFEDNTVIDRDGNQVDWEALYDTE